MGTQIKLGLLGNNIGRSRAKHLHELLGELNSLELTYLPIDLASRSGPVSIAEELELCRAQGFRGVNVTHPYKKDAYKCVIPLDSLPDGLTSINTVLFTYDDMQADNTDYTGCIRAFTSRFGLDFSPGRVLMLGAGGVGVAIAFALQKLGATELVVFDTVQETAEQLVGQLQQDGMAARLAGDNLIEETRRAEGLVNATPIGMFHYPGCAFPETGIERQRWAFDAVYTPEITEFMGICRSRGVDTLTGFYLFFYQGIDAFHRFTGIVVDEKEAESIFLKRYPLE